MLVHSVVALAPLAAGGFVLEATTTTIGAIDPAVWPLLLRGSLIGMLLLSLPAILTGISERNHMYVNWPPSHGIKLAVSIALVVLVIWELGTIVVDPAPLVVGSALGLAVIVGNNLAVLALAAYGLRITLGRISLAPTSYTPDMDLDPPVDILDAVAGFAADPARLIEVREERS
jgi:hypothetical protein